MAFGIGAAGHDMETMAETPGNPLLLHIHHLFFNIGYLLFLISLIVLIVATLKSRND